MVGWRLAGSVSTVALPCASVLTTPTFMSAMAGQIFGDRIGQKQPALLDQHHDGDRGHRLAHGREREDGVARHRHLAGGIEKADRLEVGELAFAGDRHDGAG